MQRTGWLRRISAAGTAASVLLVVSHAFAQESSAGVSAGIDDPVRARARAAMPSMQIGMIAPAAAPASTGTGVSSGPWSQAENNGLEIEGTITYESKIYGATGESSFSADRIVNYRTTATGFLRLQLWATKSYPTYGGSISFYDLGYVDMNPIGPGYVFENMMTSGRTFNAPPAGTYYISLVLLEYTNGSYLYNDIRTFDKTWTIGSGSTPSCSATTSKFCAQSNRFSVTLWARDQRTGTTDTGHVMLSTGVYGMFAFPSIAGNTSDPQVFVKVLDGRPINGKWWVFCSTLTDEEFKVTVTDTQTGQSRVYHKLAGTTTSTFDTGAF